MSLCLVNLNQFGLFRVPQADYWILLLVCYGWGQKSSWLETTHCPCSGQTGLYGWVRCVSVCLGSGCAHFVLKLNMEANVASHSQQKHFFFVFKLIKTT